MPCGSKIQQCTKLKTQVSHERRPQRQALILQYTEYLTRIFYLLYDIFYIIDFSPMLATLCSLLTAHTAFFSRINGPPEPRVVTRVTSSLITRPASKQQPRRPLFTAPPPHSCCRAVSAHCIVHSSCPWRNHGRLPVARQVLREIPMHSVRIMIVRPMTRKYNTLQRGVQLPS